MTIYLIIDKEDAIIDSIWSTRAGAEIRIEELNVEYGHPFSLPYGINERTVDEHD